VDAPDHASTSSERQRARSPESNPGASGTPLGDLQVNRPSTASQKHALGIFALGAAAALVWLSLLVASGLFLGTFLAFSLLGLHERFSRRSRHPGLSAIILALSSPAFVPPWLR